MCLCRYLSNLNWRFARGEVTDTPIMAPIAIAHLAIGGLGGSPKEPM